MGASGPLGRLISRELVESGHDVSGVSRSGGDGLAALDVYRADLVRDLLQRARPQAVVDLSRPALAGGTADEDVVDRAISGHRAFLRECADAGVERMVFASSGAVYGTSSSTPHRESEALRPHGPYARLKATSEENVAAMRESGAFPGLALAFRIFNVYGPGFTNSLVNRLVEGAQPPPSVFVSKRFVRDYIHGGDVARAIAAAIGGATLSTPVLNLGTGVGTSNTELLSMLPHASFAEDHGVLKASFSVADMTLTHKTLELAPFATIAEAAAHWGSR